MALWLGLAAVLLVMVAIVGAGVAAVAALVRRNAARAGEFRSAWAAMAGAHGLVLAPGSATRDPVLSGSVGGWPVTLTVSSYRMGADSASYAYTVARAPVRTAGEALVADRARVHHVAPVTGPELAVAAPGLAASHVARGQPPALVAALLAPDVAALLARNGVSHLRVGGGELLVQRPGHHTDAGVCLGLLQLAADLARRL